MSLLSPDGTVDLTGLASITEAYTRTDPVDIFRAVIATKVATLADIPIDQVFPAVAIPRQNQNGDFCVAIPRLRIRGKPVEICAKLADQFAADEVLESASASGIFLNFRINPLVFRRTILSRILEQRNDYGSNTSGNGRHKVVEFSSPNIAKPFHAGHLRGTIIGNFMVNALKANGYKVTAINYPGDWGKQYGLLAVGYGLYGDDEKLKSNPMQHLYEVYVRINKDKEQNPEIDAQARSYFKSMEDGEKDALALWQRFRDLSIESLKKTYSSLNIRFDHYSGESQVPEEKVKLAKQLLVEHGLVEKNEDGSLLVDLEAHKLGKTILQKKDGATLYLTRDLGEAIKRHETYDFDELFYVVGMQQDLYFRQLVKMLELCELDWAKKIKHIGFGLVNGMSTRKGTAVFLDNLLETAQEKMLEQMQENQAKFSQISNPETTAFQIGMSAIVVQDMSAQRIKNYDFDWDRMLSFEGDTGPYLQYAHARLSSIERNAELERIPPTLQDVKLELLSEPIVHQILHCLAQWPSIVRHIVGSYEPVAVVTYLFKLCRLVSASYDHLRVKGRDEETRKARILLYWSARTVLGQGLRLIGLTPLERM